MPPSGNLSGCFSASVISALILPSYVPPDQSGKSAMSRGKLIIAALPVAGSTLTTISGSVSRWVRISLQALATERRLTLHSALSGILTGGATGKRLDLAGLRG